MPAPPVLSRGCNHHTDYIKKLDFVLKYSVTRKNAPTVTEIYLIKIYICITFSSNPLLGGDAHDG